MNRFDVVLTLFFSVQLFHAGELNHSYHTSSVSQANIKWNFYSHHDMSSNKDALSKLVFTGKLHTLDLRAVENAIMKLHNESQPWYIRHRGKIGFFTGMGIMSLPLLFILRCFPSIYHR